MEDYIQPSVDRLISEACKTLDSTNYLTCDTQDQLRYLLLKVDGERRERIHSLLNPFGCQAISAEDAERRGLEIACPNNYSLQEYRRYRNRSFYDISSGFYVTVKVRPLEIPSTSEPENEIT